MRCLLWLAAAASVVPVAGQAQTVVHPHRLHAQRLPPISGTIRVAPAAFGHAGRRVAVRRPAALPRIVTGGVWPGQVQVTPNGQAFGYRALTPAERWATGGTGLAGLIGNTGNPFAGETAWGTADSATTGSGRFGGAWAYERPLVQRYGEPAVIPGSYDVPSYGAAPQLGFYGSGAPSSMSYYSSGSSAGPWGSPGGLATYRSGSYGYGPRIVTIPAGYRAAGGCACGPRVIRLGRRHHAVVID